MPSAKSGPATAMTWMVFFIMLMVNTDSFAEQASRDEVVQRVKSGAKDFANLEAPGIDLSGLDFSGASLFGANLKGANLSRARLTRCNLNSAILRDAVLVDADLREAQVFSTVMANADLSGLAITMR